MVEIIIKDILFVLVEVVIFFLDKEWCLVLVLVIIIIIFCFVFIVYIWYCKILIELFFFDWSKMVIDMRILIGNNILYDYVCVFCLFLFFYLKY